MKKISKPEKKSITPDTNMKTSVSPLPTTIKWENPRNKPVPNISVIFKKEK